MSRLTWGSPKSPDKDIRPFDQRGLTKVRLIPSTVDGASVNLIRRDHVDEPSSVSTKVFGATVFADPKFSCTETETTFVVDAVELSNRDAVIANACAAAHVDGSLACVFPELMIDPTARAMIGDLLAKKPWVKGDVPTSPKFVVAGSWHEMEAGKLFNIATVFNGHGKVLLRHKKRYPYTDPDGRAEKIHFGKEFAILVLDDALVAFGICLDFCNRCFSTVYGELDVDFVIVPSCGNAATMEGHIITAKDLHRARKARSFVVQQAYPPVENGSGFVLNPDGKPKGWEPDLLLVAAPGSTFTC
ncbi:hypothetical protein [Bradyrhizobium sp. USDA 4486]